MRINRVFSFQIPSVVLLFLAASFSALLMLLVPSASAAPRPQLTGSEAEGFINFGAFPNAAQFLPVVRNAILANRNPGRPQDGSQTLTRGPLIQFLDSALGQVPN